MKDLSTFRSSIYRQKIEKKCNNVEIIEAMEKGKYKAQKMASYLNHTATTNYLCCVPTLEDSQELVV